MAYPWWSMTQHGRTLLFLWIQAVLFFVSSGGVSAEIFDKVAGTTTQLGPCRCDTTVDQIERVVYGRGTTYTGDSSVIIIRNKTHVTKNQNEHFDVDEDFRLVIHKTLSNDSGDYWCQVTPVGRLSCPTCSFTLNVTPNVANEPAYRQNTTTSRAPRPTPAALKVSPTSEAAPMFTSSTFTMALCLVSGILTIWRGFLPVRLTT